MSETAGDFRPVTLPSLRIVRRLLESLRRLDAAHGSGATSARASGAAAAAAVACANGERK